METSEQSQAVKKIIGDLFGSDGPYDRDATVRAALMVAELIRYLNDATDHDEAAPDPATLDTLFGCLKTAADRLPLLLRQSASRLAAFSHHPAFVNQPMAQQTGNPKARLDAQDRAERTQRMLGQAATMADTLAAFLNAAQELLTPIVRDLPEDT